MRYLVIATVFAGVAGCTDEEQTQGCKTVTDCSNGTTCLLADGHRACRPLCDVSTDTCGGSATCGSVGVLSVDVCQPSAPPPTPDDPPVAEEQASLPCATDPACDALQAGSICAGFQGERDCTIRCSAESDCAMPELGGVSVDFLTCSPDESDTTRKACLPDARCFSNPMSCVQLGVPTMPFP